MTMENAVADFKMFDLRGIDWTEVSSNRTPSGIRVTADNSMACSAYTACIRVISDAVSSLPLHVYERLATGGKVFCSGKCLKVESTNGTNAAILFDPSRTYDMRFQMMRPGFGTSSMHLSDAIGRRYFLQGAVVAPARPAVPPRAGACPLPADWPNRLPPATRPLNTSAPEQCRRARRRREVWVFMGGGG